MAGISRNAHKLPEPPLHSNTEPSRRFIKLAEVKALTTLSTSEIYRRIASRTFPDRILLGPKSAVWIESEVLTWCAERIAERETRTTA